MLFRFNYVPFDRFRSNSVLVRFIPSLFRSYSGPIPPLFRSFSFLFRSIFVPIPFQIRSFSCPSRSNSEKLLGVQAIGLERVGLPCWANSSIPGQPSMAGPIRPRRASPAMPRQPSHDARARPCPASLDMPGQPAGLGCPSSVKPPLPEPPRCYNL